MARIVLGNAKQALHPAGQHSGDGLEAIGSVVLDDGGSRCVDVLDDAHGRAAFRAQVFVEIGEAELFVEDLLRIGAKGKDVTGHSVAMAHEKAPNQGVIESRAQQQGRAVERPSGQDH